MVVAETDVHTGKFRVLDREKEFVRLGWGYGMRRIGSEAFKRALACLSRFKRIADSYDASIRAVATSAVREAANQQEFVKLVREQTSITVEAISGFEEARLIYLGALQALPIFRRKVLLVDIGGGSTEFLVGEKRKIYYSNSLKLGGARLLPRFFPGKYITGKQVREYRRYIAGVLAPVVREIGRYSFGMFVGTSGTMLNIAAIIRAASGASETGKLNGFSFLRRDLQEAMEMVLSAKTIEERMRIKGLEPARAGIIVPGALMLEQLVFALEVRQVTVSDYALREGILFDTFEQRFQRGAHHHLENTRQLSVEHLAANLQYDRQHARHTAFLACRLFDQTRSIHRLDAEDRFFLECAALLHDIGFFVSHARHHRHSYYLIRNAELPGFTENDKEIIANIARYHRKGHPELNHEGFRVLDAKDRNRVIIMSGILRIADGLDRSHAVAVKDVRCKVSRSKLTIYLEPATGASVELERWGADQKKNLLESAIHKNVNFPQHST